MISPMIALVRSPPASTTITSPGSARSSALCTIRLSPGRVFTVNAGPAMRAALVHRAQARPAGAHAVHRVADVGHRNLAELRHHLRRRPCARGAESGIRSRLSSSARPRIDSPRVAVQDLVALTARGAPRCRRCRRLVSSNAWPVSGSTLCTAPKISEANRMLSAGITFDQQLHARAVVHAGVEEHVAEQVLAQRLAHVLREAAIASPVIRHGAAAVRDHEPQRREVAEQVALDQLHEHRGVAVDEVRARACGNWDCTSGWCGSSPARRARPSLVQRVPAAVGDRRAAPVTARWIGIEVAPDEAELGHAAGELRDALPGARRADRRARRSATCETPRARAGSSCSARDSR